MKLETFFCFILVVLIHASSFSQEQKTDRLIIGTWNYGIAYDTIAVAGTNAITDTTADENPSFSPNGRLIIYATQQQGREALMTTTVDGKIKARLAGQNGDIREPDWGPMQK